MAGIFFFLPSVSTSDNNTYNKPGEVDCTIFVISTCQRGLVLSWSVVKARVQKDSVWLRPGRERGAQQKACALTARVRRGEAELAFPSTHSLSLNIEAYLVIILSLSAV